MRQFSDIISWLLVIIGLAFLSSLITSTHSIYLIIGIVLFSLGFYRIVNNIKRKELISTFLNIEQLPEDKRKITIEEIIRKTKPETWHWKLIIFFLIFIIFSLMFIIAYTYFDIQILVKPRRFIFGTQF
jgi:hypothetical protein